MMKNTWQEESGKRSSFSDIVHFLHEQNIKDTPVDEVGSTTDDDSSYLDLSKDTKA